MNAASQHPLGMSDTIQRLNKVPLLVVAGILFLVVSLLFLALYRRGQDASVAVAEKEKLEELAAQGPKRIGELIGSDTTSGIVDPREYASGPKSGLPASAAGQLPAGKGSHATPLPNRAAPALTDEHQARARQFRENLLYEALVASSVVATDEITKPPSDTGPASSVMRSDPPPGNDPNLQGRKEQLSRTERRYGYSLERKTKPVNPYVLRVGTVIPAVMLTGINSDLPGMITAQVSLTVRDTATGHHVLIPQGAKLIGSYDNRVAMGQRRVLIAWHRLQYPDAAVIELGNMPGADVGGYAGFEADVDNHYLRIFGNAFLLSMVSAGTSFALASTNTNNNNELTVAEIARQETNEEITTQWAQLGQRLIERNLNIQPTLTVDPGYRFSVFVNKDLVLEPYVKS